MRRNNLILLAVLVAVFVVAVVVGTRTASGDEPFGGTDAAATEAIGATGYEPWWEPIFAPAGEVESGLFALQAGLGAGVLGFVLGTLRERRRHPDPQ